jgi:hypothetical protein
MQEDMKSVLTGMAVVFVLVGFIIGTVVDIEDQNERLTRECGEAYDYTLALQEYNEVYFAFWIEEGSLRFQLPEGTEFSIDQMDGDFKAFKGKNGIWKPINIEEPILSEEQITYLVLLDKSNSKYFVAQVRINILERKGVTQ